MIGLIGGTGLTEALLGEIGGTERSIDTPYGPTSAPIRLATWKGVDVAVLARHGAGHLLNPSEVPYRANVYAMKALGVTHVIASGAVGSLRDEIRPRDLVIPDQVIDKTCRRAPTFFDSGLAVHVEFSQPYCVRLRDLLISVARRVETTVHPSGTYVCMEGPAFSTVAESRLHRAWGGDVIGMTSVPEAKLAREAEMCYALIGLATDYDCWRPRASEADGAELLKEITGHLKAASAHAVCLMRAAVDELARHPPPPCPCQTALELAIWSDRSRIDPALAERYGPLLRKYVPNRAARQVSPAKRGSV